MAISPESFYKKILVACNVGIDEAFGKYTLLQTIAYISLIAGILCFQKRPDEHHMVLPNGNYQYKNIKHLALTLFATGMAGYAYTLYNIGGIVYLLTHLQDRVALQAGQSALMLMQLAPVGCIMLLVAYGLEKKKLLFVLFLICFICLAFAYSAFGARKNTIVLIITCIVAVHYVIKRLQFNFLTVTSFTVLFLIIGIYVVAIPIVRGDLKKEAASNSVRVFVYHSSYTFIDIFAANYFNSERAWKMQGYFSPAGNVFSTKPKDSLPQTDQGVYFKSIVMRNKDYRPPLPRACLIKTSWPTENFGFAYANFLLPGLIICFFLQGMVFTFLYRLLSKDYYNPALLCLYVIAILTFNFSSLRIATFLRILPFLYLSYVLFNLFGRGKGLLESLKIKL
ncbi:hypothetical protein ACLI09_10955 [Flavobacterium sp. RHBU_24]|uniref:hypothetical protein n=1 Tax=Flavobacterium sp. RHBU_24 TaxID=3391185 RepID=UPI00398540B7